MPGCLGINDDDCGRLGMADRRRRTDKVNPPRRTGEMCTPSCKSGFTMQTSKRLRCMGESIGYELDSTAPGDFVWHDETPRYTEYPEYKDMICHTPESSYSENDILGFRFGAGNSQIGGWEKQKVSPTNAEAWRIGKSEPVGENGLDSGISQENALRSEECWRFCDFLNGLKPADEDPRVCVGVNVAEGLYCYPIASEDNCGPGRRTRLRTKETTDEFAPMIYQGDTKVHPGFKTYFRKLFSADGAEKAYQPGLELKTTPQCTAKKCRAITSGSSEYTHGFMRGAFDIVKYNVHDCTDKQAEERCEIVCMPGYVRSPLDGTNKASWVWIGVLDSSVCYTRFGLGCWAVVLHTDGSSRGLALALEDAARMNGDYVFPANAGYS